MLFTLYVSTNLFAENEIKVNKISSDNISINGNAAHYFEIIPGEYNLKFKGTFVSCKLKLRRKGKFDIDNYIKYHPKTDNEYHLSFVFSSTCSIIVFDTDGFRISNNYSEFKMENYDNDQDALFQRLLEPEGTVFEITLNWCDGINEEDKLKISNTDIGAIQINKVGLDWEL